MLAWNVFVGFLSVALAILTTAYGGNPGFAIITLSLLTRILLLPVTLRLARQAQMQQETLRNLEVELKRLKIKYKYSPNLLFSKISELYRRRGVKSSDGASLLGVAAQLVVGAGVYSAIKRGLASGGRFLWIPNLAQPDPILVVATGLLTAIASLLAPHLPNQSRVGVTLLPTVLTMLLAWRLASGAVLYWATSTAMNGFQNLLLRRSR